MTIAIEVDRNFDGSSQLVIDAISRSLSSRLGLKVPVEAHEEGTLPRYEAKAQRVLERK